MLKTKIKQCLSAILATSMLVSNTMTYAEEVPVSEGIVNDGIETMQTEDIGYSDIVQTNDVTGEPEPETAEPAVNDASGDVLIDEITDEEDPYSAEELSCGKGNSVITVRNTDDSRFHKDSVAVVNGIEDLFDEEDPDKKKEEENKYRETLLTDASLDIMESEKIPEEDRMNWIDAYEDLSMYIVTVYDQDGNEIKGDFSYSVQINGNELSENIENGKTKIYVIGHKDDKDDKEKDTVYDREDYLVYPDVAEGTSTVEFTGDFDYYLFVYKNLEYLPEEVADETENQSKEEESEFITVINDDSQTEDKDEEIVIEEENEEPVAETGEEAEAVSEDEPFEEAFEVITKKDTELKTAPDENAETVLLLEEGKVLTVTRRSRNGWMYVTVTSDGEIYEGYLDPDSIGLYEETDTEKPMVLETEDEKHIETDAETESETMSEAEDETESGAEAETESDTEAETESDTEEETETEYIKADMLRSEKAIETKGQMTSVIFNPTGGVLPIKTMQAELGVTVAESLPVPTKDGHIFLGWFSQREGGYQLNEGDVIDRNLWFAQWQEISYTLILHPNGTGDEPLVYEMSYKDIQELNDEIFTTDGYILGSWNTDRFGKGTSYPANTEVSRLTETDGDTITLYAIWSDTPYSITFDEQGGSEVPDIVVADGQTAGNKIIASMKDGYTFIGWFTRPERGTQVTGSTVIHSDYYLYAHFQKNPIVTFDPNDENAIIAEKDRQRELSYGGTVGELPKVTNGSKDFIGWFTKAYGGTQISTGAIVYSDTTYYAHYGYKPYFDTAGGKITTPDRNQAKQSSSYTVTSFPVVERDGYDFVGWFLPDGETEVHLGDVVELAEDKRIIAHWEPSDKAVVTFDYNGMSGSPTSIRVYKNEPLEQLPVPSRSGYKFLGWYDENDVLYKTGSVVTDNITLTAKWAKKDIKFTFNSQGGRNFGGRDTTEYVYETLHLVDNEGNPYTQTITVGGNIYVPEGDTLTVLPGARKDGYLLEGWYTQPNGQGEKLTIDTVATEDTTYYAHWIEKNEYIDESGLKYTYSAYWNNTSNSEVSNHDDRLVFTPSTNGTVTARLYINFELEKTVDDLSLPAGAVEVRIPKYVWKNWNGSSIGSTNINNLFVKAPEIPENDYFNYYEEPDYYVITNCVPLNGGAGFLKEFEYRVSPREVRGGAIDSNGDIVDEFRYFGNTVNASVKIDKNLDGVYETNEKKQLSLEMHTKLVPFSSKSASKTVYSWDSSWGAKPADAEDYFYVVWYVTNGAYSSSTQGGTYTITEDKTTHDGTIVYSNLPSNRSYSLDGYGDRYTVVTKHPRELLNDAVLNPVTIRNEAVIKDTWQSGYKTERRVNASTRVSVIEYPVGEFDKRIIRPSVNNPNTIITGGQEALTKYGNEVYIPFRTIYNGGSNVVPSWDEASKSYSTALRTMMIQDGRPGDLKYSSGASDPRYVWNANVKDQVLNDNDYCLKSISINVTEYDSEYISGKWLTPWAHTNYSTFKPVRVYVRYRGDSDFTFYKSVPLTTSTSATVNFPDNVVGYRVEHDSNFFKTLFYVDGQWYIEPTSRIYNLVSSDIDNGVTSIFKNQANCKVWWPLRDGVPEHAGLGEENSIIDVTAWRYYELNMSKDYLYADKYISSATVNPSNHTQTSRVRISGWNYNNAGNMFKTDTGVLYDLLPKGVSVNKDSVTGYAVGNRAWKYSNYSGYSHLDQLDKNYYNVSFVNNWEGSGRTMMIIEFVIPKGIYATGADFFYDMVDSQSNIEFYGTSRENDIAYANTSEITRDIAGINYSKDIITDKHRFDAISDEHTWVAYARDYTGFQNLISETWGFDKSVKTETTTGYVFDGTTPLNEDYTYKLHYSQSDNSRTHNLVIYDVLEAGTDLIGSEWLGTFVSADASDYARVRNASPEEPESESESEEDGEGEGDDSGDEPEPEPVLMPFCAPVIYYSTKPRDEFPEVDQNFSMEGTIYNLSDDSVWSTTPPEDLSLVTAVAFDMRKDAEGNDMIFAGKKSLNVYIRMHSPSNTEFIEKTNGNSAVVTSFRESSGDTTYEHSEASVRIIDEDVELHKTSDPESGTREEPAKVSRQEPLVYTLSVKNTGTEYIMKDVVVEDEIPDGLKIKNIQVHFGDESAKINIEDSPRVTMETDGRKRTFTIKRLNKEETCYILINTIVLAEDSYFENGSEVTSVNGIEKHIESETTYHGEENSMEVTVRKESDSRTPLAGASLQILDSEGTVVDSWVSTTQPHKVRLFPGTYTLHEVSAPNHFLVAEDISFEVTQDKYLKVEGRLAPHVKMTDVETTDVEGVKNWFGDGTGSGRPSSITVNLVRDGEVIDTKTVTKEDNWEYSWKDLEKYSAPGKEYIYQVLEAEVPEGYTFFDETGEIGRESSGLEFVFSSSSRTESTTYDWIYFYYQKDGKWYRTNKYGGSNLKNTIVRLPSEMAYIEFRSDGSSTYYGFSFSSITEYKGNSFASVTNVNGLPTGYSNYGTYVGSNKPSYTNYSNNQQRRWLYKLKTNSTWDGHTVVLPVPEGEISYDMTNAKPKPVRIAKIGENSNILPGAEMTLTGTEFISGKDVSINFTSESTITTVNLFPGDYVLHEVTPPDGYYKNSDVEFSVSMEGEITFTGTKISGTDVCLRDYRTKLYVYKYNRASNYQAGCTFQIWREADVLDPDSLTFAEGAEPVKEWTTTGTYNYFQELLNSGENYWLIETDVPEGFEKLPPYFIRVEETATSSTTISVSLYNEWEPVDIEVSKKNKDGGFVEGATLRLTGTAKTKVDPTESGTTSVTEEWVTTGEPKALSLKPGNYTLTEVKRPGSNEYLLNTESISIYVTNDRQVYYLRRNDDGLLERIDSADIVMYDEYNKTELPFKKVWNDTGYEESRPSSITFELYQNGTKYDEQTLTADDASGDYTWEGVFTDLPILDPQDKEYEYKINEIADIENYRTTYNSSETSGMLVTFSNDTDLGDGSLSMLVKRGSTWYNAVMLDVTDFDSEAVATISGDRLAGKTIYVPTKDTDGRVAIKLSDATKSRNFTITNIMPTSAVFDGRNGISNSSFNETQITSVWKSADYPHLSEIGASSAKCILFAAGGASQSFVGADIITNTSLLTSVELKKMWEDGGDVENRPTSIILDLYNEQNLDTPVQTVELTAEDSDGRDIWTKTIKNLPQFNQDGTEARYLYTERGVEGYRTFYSKSDTVGARIKLTGDSTTDGGTLNFIVPNSTRSANNYLYVNGVRDFTDVAGLEVFVPFYTDYNDVFLSLRGAGQNANITIESVTPVSAEDGELGVVYGNFGNTNETGYYSGENVQVLTGNGVIRYRYPGESGVASVGSYVVNESAKTSIVARKRWEDADHEDARPETVTVEIVNEADPETVIREVELSGNGDTWELEVQDLDRYNEDGTQAHYLVREKDAVDNYKTFYESSDTTGFLVKFAQEQNFQGTVRFYGLDTKNLITSMVSFNGRSDLSASDIAGQEIYIEKKNFNGFAFQMSNRNASNALRIESVEAVNINSVAQVNSYASTYSLYMNPENITDITGQAFSTADYGAVDFGVYEYYSGVIEPYYGSEIVNRYNLTEVSVKKRWDGDNEEDRPDSITFNLYNAEDMETVLKTKDLPKTATELTFENLPKYKEDGSLIQYVVKEEETENYNSYYAKANESEAVGFLVEFEKQGYLNYIYVQNGERTGAVPRPKIEIIGEKNHGPYYGNMSAVGRKLFVPFSVNAEGEEERAFMIQGNGLKIKNIELAYDESLLENLYRSDYNSSNVISLYNNAIFTGSQYPDYEAVLNENGNASYPSTQTVYMTYIGNGSETPVAGDVVVTNRKNTRDIPFKKIFDDEGFESVRPDAVTVYLKDADGNTVAEKEVEVTESEITGVFENIPYLDEDGNEIQYHVEEEVPDGYKAFYSMSNPKGFLVTFSEDTDLKSNSMYLLANPYGGFSDTFYSGASAITEDTSIPFSSISRTGTSLAGKTIYIPITENFLIDGEDPYFALSYYLYTSNAKAGRSHYAITNIRLTDKYEPHMFTTGYTYSYPFKLFRQFSGTDYPGTEKSMGNYSNGSNSDMSMYVWKPVASPFDGCNVIYNRINKTQFEVTKDWEVYDESTPSSITIDLYDSRDMSTPVATKDIAVTEKTSKTVFTDLPKYDEDGNEIVYTAKERAVEGYIAQYGNSDYLDGHGGLYVTFSDDTDMGSSGYVVLYTGNSPAHSSGNNYCYYTDDIKGKTVFVPTESYSYPLNGKPSVLCVYFQPSGTYTDCKLKITDISWGYEDTAEWPIYSTTRTVPSSPAAVLGMNEGFDSDEYNKMYSSGYLLFRLNPDSQMALSRTCVPGSNYIYNKVDKVDIPYSKTWDDEGYEQYRPDSVTFRVYNVNDLETEVAHVTLDTEEDTHGVFEDLPKYNEDGTEAVYIVKEDPVEGYTQTWSLNPEAKKPSGFKVTFSDDTYITDGYLYVLTNTGYAKYVNGTYYPSGNKLAGETVYLRTHQVYNSYGFFLNYYNSSSNYQADLDNYRAGKQHFQIVKVEPTYQDDVGGYYYPFYTSYNIGWNCPNTNDYRELNEWFNITSGNTWMGYILKDVPEPMAGLTDITNHTTRTKVEFTKSWQNEEEGVQRPESITVDLYREDTGEIVDTLTLSSGETDGVFDDLPKYNDSGEEIRYFVKERPVPGYITRYAANDDLVNGFYITFSDDFNMPANSYVSLGYKYSAGSSGGSDTFTMQYLDPHGKWYYPKAELLRGRTIFVPFDSTFSNEIINAQGRLYGYTHESGTPHELGVYWYIYPGTTSDITGGITNISLGYEPNKNRFVLGGSNNSAYGSTFSMDSAITPARGRHYPDPRMYNATSPYSGNTSSFSTYMKYIWEDDEYGSATPSFGATNIVNVYQPYKVTKQWNDEGHENERPDTITLRFYDPENPSEAVLVKEIPVSDADEQEYVIDELPVQRADGTYIKYLVSEDDVDGYVTRYSMKDITGFWLDFDYSKTEPYIGNSSNYITFAGNIERTPTNSYNKDYMEYTSAKYSYAWKFNSENGGNYYLYARDFAHPIFVQKSGGNVDGFLLYASNIGTSSENWKFEVENITPVRRDITYEGSLSTTSRTNNSYTGFTTMSKAHLKGDNYPISSKYYYQLWEWEPVFDYTKVPDCNLIINEIDKTDLPVQKTWDDEGHEDKRPETLTFSVYNVRDMETVVRTETVDVDETGTYVFEDLPKYNSDGTKAQYKVVETKTGYYEPSYEVYGMGEEPDGFIVKLSNDTVITNGYLSMFPIRNSFYLAGRMIDNYGGQEFGGSSYLIWSDYLNSTIGSLANNRYIYVPNICESSEDCGFVLYSNYNDSTRNIIKIDSVEPVYGSLDQYGQLGEYLIDHYFVNGNESQPNINKSYNNWTYYNSTEINGHIGTGENLLTLGSSYMVYRWNADEDYYNYQNDPTKLVRPRAYRVRNTYEPKKLKVEKEWDDEGYEEDRPESLTFKVKADGTVIKTLTLTQDDAVDDYHWRKEIEDLPKYNANGTEIVYTIEETVPEGYHLSYGLRKVKGLLVTFDDDTAVWNGGWSAYSAYGGMIGSLQYYIQKAGDVGSNKWFYVPVGGNTYYFPVEDNPDADTIDFFIQGGHMYGAHVAISDIKPVYCDEPNFYYLSRTAYSGDVVTSDTRADVLDWYYGQGPLQVFNKYYGSDGENTGISGKYIRVHKPTQWVEGTSFVNSRVKVPFEKIWDDGGVEELRPESITVSLYNKRDMETPVETKEFAIVDGEIQNPWFDNMPRYNNDGTLIEWTVREAEVENYRTRVISGENPRGFFVTFSDDTVMYGSDSIKLYSGRTNTYSLGKPVGAQPYYSNPSITGYEASGNTFYVQTAPVNANSTELIFHEIQVVSSFSDPRSKYRITSIVPDFDSDLVGSLSGSSPNLRDDTRPLRTVYGTDYPESSSTETVRWIWKDGMQIVNEADKVRLKVDKYWDDDGFEDLRPNSVVMDIKNGDEVVDSVTLTKDGDWTGYSDYLPKYNAKNEEITYTIEEHVPSGYTKTNEATGFTGFRVKFSEDTNTGGILIYTANSECGDTMTVRDIGETLANQNLPLSSDLAGAVVYIPINHDPISTATNVKPAMSFILQVFNSSDTFRIESIEPVSGIPDDATIILKDGRQTSSTYPKDLCGRICFNENYPSKTADNTSTWFYYELTDDNLIPASASNTIKKWPVSINKVNDIGEFVAGAELQIKRKDTGAVVETVVSDGLNKLNVLLPAGTYVIHESYTPENYEGLEEDIEFTISADGTVTIDEKPVEDIDVLNRELVKIDGTKTWTGDEAPDRPESITVNLYADGEKVDEKTVTAEDDWKYDFGLLERYNEDGEEIVYTVDEEIVRGYGRRVTNGSAVETLTNDVGVNIRLTENSNLVDGTLDIYYEKNSKWYHIPVSTPLSGKTIYVPTCVFYAKVVTRSQKQVFGFTTEKLEYVSGQRTAGEELASAPEIPGTASTIVTFDYVYPAARTSWLRYTLGNSEDHLTVTEDVYFPDFRADITNGIENFKLPDPFEVSFKKVDTQGTMLAGAEFTITGREDGAHYDIIPMTFTSSADTVTVKNLRPGSYHLKETKAPVGCLRELHDIDFTVDEEGVVTIGEDAVDVVSMTDSETVFKVQKIDKDTNAPVSNATFKILDTDENTITEWTTDGTVKTFRGILDVEKDYILRETSVPENYEKMPDITFSLNADGSVQIGEEASEYLELDGGVLNILEEKMHVKFRKVDTNGNPVTGAGFTLTGQGTVQFTETWTSDGTDHTITGIKPGRYTLEETTPPPGFVAISPVTVDIDEYGTVTVTDTVNEEKVKVDNNDVSIVVITNKYADRKLSVKKTVSGNMGNKTKKFDFTLTLTGDNLPQVLKYRLNGVDGTEDNFTGTYEFKLAHGDVIEFPEIPYNTVYEVTEETEPGYTTTKENENGTLTEDTVVTFNNERNLSIPTLANTPIISGILLAGLILVLIAVWMILKKKRVWGK